MAKNNLSAYTAADGLGFPLNFRRGNPNPLDNSSVWSSYSAAQTYASSDPTAYVGQLLSVVAEDGNSVTVYSIQNEAGTLKEVGTVPTGDEKSITVVDGVIKILGVDDAVSGAQLVKQADGTVAWIKPDATTVEGLQTAVANLESNKADKSYVDQKLSSVYRYKGTVTSVDDLPTADQVEGDTYNVETSGTIGSGKSAIEVHAGDNVAWVQPDGSDGYWDVLAGIVDISGKVDKVEGSRLMTDTEGTKLQNIEDGAQVNVIDSVDTAQFNVDGSKKLTLLEIAMSKVSGLEEALDNKVNVGDVETGAQVNVLESVKINSTELDVSEKAVNIPIGGANLGVVKTSSAENGISINSSTGEMSVNSVNVVKLSQTEEDSLILDGGSASSN